MVMSSTNRNLCPFHVLPHGNREPLFNSTSPTALIVVEHNTPPHRAKARLVATVVDQFVL